MFARSRRLALCLALASALVLTAIPAATAESDAADGVRTQAAALQQWRADLAGQPVADGTLLVTTEGDAAAFSSDLPNARPLTSRVSLVTVEAGTEAAEAAELAARPDVVAVEPNVIRSFHAVPDDPAYADQWAHQLTGIEEAWDVTTGSADVLVAVADSGIVASHPDLGARIVEQVDSGTGEILPGSEDNDLCQVGHGTWVAGVVGAIGNNGNGVAGVNWDVSLLDINTANPEITCDGPTDAGTIAAISYAAQQGADVVNLSLGGPSAACPTAMQAAIDEALAAGTVVVAASGNSGSSTPETPASCNGVISVGAVGPDAEPSHFSTFNPYVDLTAPGGAGTDGTAETEILTTSWWAQGERTPEIVPITGTSFSSPYVAGVAALLRAVNPDLTPAEVEGILEQTAQDLGEPGRDEATGWGLVQAGAAVALAAEGGEAPQPEPDPEFPVGGTPVGQRPGGDVDVIRIAPPATPTTPIAQAIATSQATFADAGVEEPNRIPAQWAVVARDDDYADALAGSALSLGVAPLLYTTATGGLDPATAAELQRVLPAGSPVYVLGGPVAVPAQVDADIAGLGLQAVRLAGDVREATAIAVADQLTALLDDLGVTPSAAILANRQEWPDAVGAGELAAGFGIPVLLTPAESLDPGTAAWLEALAPDVLYVVGGTVRITERTQEAAAAAAGLDQAGQVVRLAGEERVGTIVAVSTEVERILGSTPIGRPAFAHAVNVRRADAWAHMLSAAAPLAAFSGVYVPVEGEGGTEIPAAADAYARGLGITGALVGGSDLISDDTAAAFEVLLETPPEG